MRIRRMLYVLTVSLAIWIAALPGYGQVSSSSAAIQGAVLDEQGAAVPNATVTVSNLATGLGKTTKTGADGTYQILSLNPGTYHVEIEATGFEKQVAASVVLTLGQIVAYDARLKVGAVSVVVEVAGNAAPLIETEQTQQANAINENQVEDLPNINRNFVQAVYTLPGVSNSESPRGGLTPGFAYPTTGFSIGGSNGRNNLSTVDGGENEYGTGAYRVPIIPLDSIQEYQVNRSSFAAEFGFTDGAAINLVTKSGTNQYHGSVFGNFYDEHTNAQSFFTPLEHANAVTAGDPSVFPLQPFQQNVYAGASMGGPIRKDKLFFFTAYEFQKLDLSSANPLLSLCEVQGLADAGASCPQQAAQQMYLNLLLASPNPAVHDAGVQEQAENLFSPLLALPSYASMINRENGTFVTDTRNNNWVTRLDYQPNQSNSISIRLGLEHNETFNTDPDGGLAHWRDYSILLNWTHSFSPTLLNQTLIQGVPWDKVALPQKKDNGSSLFALGLGPGGGSTSFGQNAFGDYIAHQRRAQVEDSITWTRGAHTIKFGGSFHLADYYLKEPLYVAGVYVFVPLPALLAAPPADKFAVFLSGIPDPGLTASNTIIASLPFKWQQAFGNPAWNGYGKYFGAFLQDTWKVTRNFTLSPGIRLDYDGEPPPITGNTYPSPRLGFAWDPFGDHKTVIRGGGGLYGAPVDTFIPAYASILNGTSQYLNDKQASGVPGFAGLGGAPTIGEALYSAGVSGGTFNGVVVAPNTLPLGHLSGAQVTAISQAEGLGVTDQPGTGTGQVIFGVQQGGYKYPYTIQASLSVEQQLASNLSLEVGYIFYHGVHLQLPYEAGYGLADCTTGALLPANATAAQIFAAKIDVVGNCYSPVSVNGLPPGTPNNPTVAENTIYTTLGHSVYHGVTASLTKRYSRNFQFQANYTFSHSIDNDLDFASFQEWYRPARGAGCALNFCTYTATSTFNVPQQFTANLVYTSPRAAEGILGKIYENMAISPIVTLSSGLPFSLLTEGLANGAPPNPSTGQRPSGGDVFLAGADSATPILEKRNGNSALPFYTLDLSIRKGFYLLKDEKLKVELSVQGTNILNRSNFNNLVNNYSGVTDAASAGACNKQAMPQILTGCITTTGSSNANLATGPYKGYTGFKPTATDLQNNAPLSYAPSGNTGLGSGSPYLPRQVEFGIRLTF
ncbi:MAG TPA: TonB-dependent receptor [Candidatus Acidoferrales bacterium]|nr:TonB-dependent receptor [Candidatus Acidoferrales bacterium]